MKDRRQVKEGFLRQLRHGLCMCAIRRVNGQDKRRVFEQVMVVGARRTSLCQELQSCWIFHAQKFPVYIKNGPPPKGHPANLKQTVGGIGVNMGQYPCGTL